MKQLSARKSKDLLQYILSDYQFLEDYEIITPQRNSNNHTFVANIRNTQQKVRFLKRKYSEDQLPRFRALHSLFINGIILADSMFILEECEEFYYYVIEAEIQIESSRFQTLHHYLYNNDINEEQGKAMLGKIKILIDCLHQEGQAYAGLDPRKIIIDDEKHLYLAPFNLEFELRTDNYSRSYYPPQILTKISKGQAQISEQMMQKWDIWAFGCICMELLAFSSPIFLTTSLPRQLNEILTCEMALKNMVLNSLTIDSTERTISTVPPNIKIEQESQLQNAYHETITNITTLKKEDVKNDQTIKELNLHQNSSGEEKISKMQTNKKTEQSPKENKASSDQALKELSSNLQTKNSKSFKEPCSIPTISQISQNLSLLNEQIKRKMCINEPPEQESTQRQLSQLLQIE